MSKFEYEASFDEQRNMSFTSFINHPTSKEEVERCVDAFRIVWKGNGKNKNWNITDTRKMGMAPTKLVIYYNKLAKSHIKKYLEDYVVVAGTILEKVATRLFNVFMGERHPVVSTMEEAYEIIEKWQKEKGIFCSLIEE